MRIFVAGAGGALGTQVVRHLVADRHEVIGFTRSAAHAEVVQQWEYLDQLPVTL